MSDHNKAIIAAISLNALTPLNSSLFKASNAFLKRAEKTPMTQEEFDAAMVSVGQTSATFKDGLKLTRKFPSMNDKKATEFLGDRSVFLVHGPVLKNANTTIEIEFNCDGKGGIRLPSGEIHKETLVSLTRKYNEEFELFGKVDASDNTKYAWKVSRERHGLTRNMNIREYLNMLMEG